MIKFLNWVAGLRPKKEPSFGSGEITAQQWRSAAALMRRRGSNPPAPNAKPEPPAGPPRNWIDPVKEKRSAGAAERLGLSPPAGPPFTTHDWQAVFKNIPTPPQAQILTICQNMQGHAEAERAAAAQLREIANSLGGVVASTAAAEEVLQSIGIVPPLARPVAAPFKPQPSGGRLIRGDVDPGPVPSPLLLSIRSAIDNEPFGDEPKAVLLAVAKWLRSRNNPCHDAAARLEREARK